MTVPRAGLVVCGEVIVAAGEHGLELAEAVGIAEGRVVSVGRRTDVLDAAASGARVHDAGPMVVVPGLHDFHIHLVGLARSRAAVRLDDAGAADELLARLRRRRASVGADGWIVGRGWSEAQMASTTTDQLEAAVGAVPAFLTSHDGHSAWASSAARRRAGITLSTADPFGGRIERDAHGEPNGVLRERAMDLVAPLVPRLQGAELREPLDATLRELAALGITGASEAGDYTDENGTGPDRALGDSYSSLTGLGDLVDGRMRMTLGIPVDAIGAAARRGLRTGLPIPGRRTMRFGWAKEYADGALGSGTAALFEPHSCDGDGTGILRVEPEALGRTVARARMAGIGLAVHAIGDRAAAVVLDVIAGSPDRLHGVPRDRIEHAQLVREQDRERFGALGVTASIQPIHAAADRDLVETCWDGRQADAYPWRALSRAGALLAAGSDAPVESVNPWLGLFAAVHRRLPSDPRADWRPEQSLPLVEALRAYTLGPARAIGASDEGHLRVGARADLAILSISRDELLHADEALAEARSELTLVGGEVST